MRARILFPISAKLIFLFSFLLAGVAMSIIFVATKVFVENNSALVQQMSIEAATQLAMRERKILEGYQAKLMLLSKWLHREASSPTNGNWDWTQEKSLAGFYLFESKPGEVPVARNRILSPRFGEWEDGNGEKFLQALTSKEDFELKKLQAGEVLFSRIQFGEEERFFLLGAPYLKNETDQSTLFHVGVFEEKELIEAFREGEAINSALVNSAGELLASSWSLTPEEVHTHPLLQKFLETRQENYQTSFLDPKTHERKIGAYHTVGFSGLWVLSEVPEGRALEIVHRVRYRAGLVAVIVFSIAFFFTYIFSKTLTSPIQRLVTATEYIREGKFSVRLNIKGRDEVAHLGKAFNEMAVGLAERDRVKEVFSRFHNKQIADKILSGEMVLGGERREAVIFFSDLRDFTTLSESLQPERVVEMINEYFSRMVAVIHRHGGVVDKYVGDAIVALWGVPLANENALKDALSACLEMRKELTHLNEIRLGRGEPALRMGMGLHVGTVIVGNIGSEQRMEYTAIGDSMNLASRIQSTTKLLGEDLLVSSEVVSRLKDQFSFESKGETQVKGKAQPVTLYKVLGRIEGELKRAA